GSAALGVAASSRPEGWLADEARSTTSVMLFPSLVPTTDESFLASGGGLEFRGDAQAQPISDLPGHGCLVGFGAAGGASQPHFARVPDQSDGGSGPVHDDGFFLFAEVLPHGSRDHVRDLL